MHLAKLSIPLCMLPHAEGLPVPAYETAGAAGMDLRAATSADWSLVIPPGTSAIIPTGVSFAVPENFEMQIRPRSGLAAKHGMTVVNSPGTIDSDFRGEIMVILHNLGDEDFKVSRGDRIAQMVLAPVTQALWLPVSNLDSTTRGAGGFGSTGKV